MGKKVGMRKLGVKTGKVVGRPRIEQLGAAQEPAKKAPAKKATKKTFFGKK